MAKLISSKDIFEDEDVFRGIRDSANKTIADLTNLETQMKKTATEIKTSLGGQKLDSTQSLKDFTQATEQATKMTKEMVKIEQEKAKLLAISEKAEREVIRTQQLREKEAQKTAKAIQNESSAYKQLEKATREAKNEAREMASQLLALEKAGKQNTDEFKKLSNQYKDSAKRAAEMDKELKAIDESVGDNFRKVGSYKQELRKLMDEMMRMDQSSEAFKIAQKRAADLKDEITDLAQETRANAGNAFEQLSNNTQLLGSRLMDLDFAGAGKALTGMAGAVKGIDFKLLNTEMKAFGAGLVDLGMSILKNPIFLVAATLTAVGVALYKYGQTMPFVTDETKQLAKATKDATDASTKALEAFDLEERKLRALGYAEEYIIQQRRIRVKEALETSKNDLKAQLKVAEELQKSLDESKQRVGKSMIGGGLSYLTRLGLEEAGKAFGLIASDQQVADQTKNIETLKKSIAEYEVQVLELNKQEKDIVDDKKKNGETTVQNTKKNKDKELELHIKAQEEMTALIEQWDREDLENAKKQADLLRQIEEDRLAEEEALAQEIENLRQGERATEEQKIRDEYFYKIERAKQLGLDYVALEEEMQRQLAEVDDKYKKKKEDADLLLAKEQKKLEKEKQDTINQSVKMSADFFVSQSQKKAKAMEQELTDAQKQADSLQRLAESGNISAQQSLAEQQKIIAEKEKERMKEIKRQQKIQLAQSVFSSYTANVENDPNTAVAKTIQDATVLTQFINSLPAFEKGTEDTGVNGRGVDGKGGFLSVLHPNERVVPKSLNEKIGAMTNEQLAQIAMSYQNGKLVRGDSAGSSLDLALLVNKLDEVNTTIRNKPETSIELGEITQTIMEVVKTTKHGNTTTYNRFKTRK